MENVKVSIIMGVYNCAETLPVAIESIINQTYTNWELVMCDDGSNDNTYRIAEEYKKKYPKKIILLRNEVNKKLAATLNKCLSFASGEYIARMDADDENFPERLEKEVEFLNNHPEITCVGTGMVIMNDNGAENIRLSKESPQYTCLIHGSPFAHPTIMMRKEAYDQLEGYRSTPETLRAEDVDLWFRFFKEGFVAYNLQEPLYKYRETKIDFKKRTLKAAIGTTKVYLKGYRMLHYSLFYYPMAFKPIVTALIPSKLMYIYHYYKDSRNAI